MIESVELFDIWPGPLVCSVCHKPIEIHERHEAVMVRVYVPSQDKYVEGGPFHKQCGLEKQAEI